jgi:hypothetical protein
VAQQVLEAQQLVGQNRNGVHGQAGGAPLEPYRVFNLAPHRRGGYAPYGRRVRMVTDALANVTLFNVTRLVGHDETGLASFTTNTASSGSLQLFRSNVLYAQAHPSYPNASDAVHLDGAGAYIGRTKYLVLDRDERLMEPIRVRADVVSEVGSSIQAQQVSTAIGNFVDVEYGAGVAVAVTDLGYIYRSLDRGLTWSSVLFSGTSVFVSVAYGNGWWLASTIGGTIFRSNDDGANWTSVAVVSWAAGSAVSWAGGGRWFYSGLGANGSTGIFMSNDDGLNWTLVDDLYSALGGSEWDVRRVAVDRNRQVYAGVAYERVPSQTAQEIFVDTQADGSFNFASAFTTSLVGSNNPYGRLPGGKGWLWTEFGFNRFYSVNRLDGRVAESWDISANVNNVHMWTVTGTVLNGRPRKVKYNAVRNTLYVVGSEIDGVAVQPAVWQGSAPSNLTRQSEIEAAFNEIVSGSIYSVAFDEDGNAIYVGAAGTVLTTGVGAGLKSGTYSLYFVSYFNTKAGRFIFGFHKAEASFNQDYGNSLSVIAQTKESILSSNVWLAARPDGADIVDDLRLDVYIQYTAESAEGTKDDQDIVSAFSGENTIRYAFTSPFPDASSEVGVDADVDQPVGREIGELPIGRQITVGGAPTTVIFEKARTGGSLGPVASRTAIHNGRVWGLASQDEGRWNSADGISLEIANQFNRFVLTYTETGWANLVSDQSFIPIQPTQSRNFTGIMSTPSGLMLLFDNEIFLVTGDPAFGNVTVELYLDMVGCDVGSIPCRLGGLPFTIWDGKIWALQAGQALDVSQTQWRPEDPFVRIAPEPSSRSLLALTQSGMVFRYLVDDQFWMTDPVNRDDFTYGEMLPGVQRVAFVESDGEVWNTLTDGTPDAPQLVYRDMDFGFPERRTPLYLAKMTLEGPISALEYDRDAVGYDATVIPALFFASASIDNGDTHETLSPQVGGIQPVMKTVGNRRVGTMSWRLPLRSTRGYSMDLRFEMRGMAYSDTIKLPLRFFFAAGGELR